MRRRRDPGTLVVWHPEISLPHYRVVLPVKWPRLTGRHQSLTTPTLYRRRHKIENMFGRLKDWRRIHTRYDRCAHTFMSAIFLAAIVIF